MAQQWDYCQCALFYGQEEKGNVLVIFAGRPDKSEEYGTPTPDGDGMDALTSAMADLGEQGWEMVAATASAAGKIERFWFKRPRKTAS